ncbi:MAG TPA: hypothetical protein VIU12_15035 [Chryseolinea sp.]
MRSFYLASLLLMTGAVSAQVPGFMGKRFSLFVDANATPAFFIQNDHNQVIAAGESARTYNSNRLAFTFRPQVTAEYLVGRNLSLGFSYSRISVGTQGARGASTDKNYALDDDVVRGKSLGLELKFFRFKKSASIAPIGFYRTVSVYLTQTNAYDNRGSKAKLFVNDFVYPVVSYGMGRQTMIAKSLLLKTGVEVGWAFTPGNWLREGPDDWNVQEFSGYNVHQSLAGDYAVTLHVALGYTLF